ncbi:F0F1 ATP synthase subunit alpha [Sedimenticola hydrogenitrophicus]|uniref:F0F1 ATP synthase subunit alpha n=1 Tax=Sedimenticola hydrogenitrophicus TaxID=2967975 RepID=UPI0023AFB5EC|nr:F0F1 ATP synthase subunit alpha [Sedimenticola hydrogenitrophicus]
MPNDPFPALRRQRRWLDNYQPGLRLAERGTLVSIGDGIAWIEGLPSAALDELLNFADGSLGQVLHLGERLLAAVLLRETEKLTAGTTVRLGGRRVSVPVDEALLGRVIDPLGLPLDGQPMPPGQVRRNLEGPSPQMIERDFVQRPLYTGIRLIDSLLPIGKGQRQLIIGDEGLGRTSIALDTVINQSGRGTRCVYVVVGQKRSEVINIIDRLREYSALEYTTVVVGEASTLPGLKYLAPYAGCAIGEAWMRQGHDCLVIYDDLTHHARAYRELSLLLRRPPGREAYPGDIFYLHARLLERATCLAPAQGGGSLTALPIVETQQGEIASYIPTNLISITDGQIYLEQKLFAAGVRPAIDVGKSVSRIGGKAQHPLIKQQAARIKLDYLQFQELESFTRFGARLEPQMQERLQRGRILRELLKQDRLKPVSETELLVWLIAYNDGLLDATEPERARDHLERLDQGIRQSELSLDTPIEDWQKWIRHWWSESGADHEQTA